ncbi:MAG: PilZ domain-containing protein [Terriglobia bacterium]
MKNAKVNIDVDRRSGDRIGDSSLLVVTGKLPAGDAFSEMTSIHDVSTGGISFYLNMALEVGELIDLSIYSEKWTNTEAVPRYQIKARVLRVVPHGNGKEQFLIAGEFAGNFVNLSHEEDFESIVRHLQRAVAHDENHRQQAD